MDLYPAAANDPPSKPRLRDRLLGAFVIFELIIIPLGSYIKLVPARIEETHGELIGDLQVRLNDDAPVVEPIQTIKDSVAFFVSRWGETTGQIQCWALFVAFSEQAALPAVEFHWPTAAQREPVVLKCYFEPADPTHYFYPPEPCCRLINYEYRTVLYYGTANRAKDAAEPERYRKAVMQSVSDQRRSTTAFLRWKFSRYMMQHPDEQPPESAVLKARIFPDPPVGASFRDRPAMYEVPVARWRPDAPDEIEVWDPIAKQFERLPATRER